MPDLKEMPHVTVEQVIRFREEALKVQSHLAAAQSENEALRARASELEVCLNTEGDSLDFQVLLSELHKEVWEGAESGDVCYDDAGRKVAKRVIACYESQAAQRAMLQAVVDAFRYARTTTSANTKAWLLRKQAEAVDDFGHVFDRMHRMVSSRKVAEDAFDYAQGLYQQADELDNKKEDTDV